MWVLNKRAAPSPAHCSTHASPLHACMHASTHARKRIYNTRCHTRPPRCRHHVLARRISTHRPLPPARCQLAVHPTTAGARLSPFRTQRRVLKSRKRIRRRDSGFGLRVREYRQHVSRNILQHVSRNILQGMGRSTRCSIYHEHRFSLGRDTTKEMQASLCHLSCAAI